MVTLLLQIEHIGQFTLSWYTLVILLLHLLTF